MASKRISLRNSRMFLLAGLAAFVAAEVTAEFLDLWLMGNPSVGNMVAFNNRISSIPSAITTAGTVFLMFGMLYCSRKAVISVTSVGIILAALPFALELNSMFSFTIEYSPGFHASFLYGVVANLFSIGVGTAIAAIMSQVFRDGLIEKQGHTAA